MANITGPDVFDLIIQILVTALYAAVAWTIVTRTVSKSARVPNMAFAMWWWGLVVLTGAGVVWTVVHWFTPPTLPAYMAYINFVLLLIMGAFAGMVYYFLYLWSGRQNLWLPIGLFYLALYVFFVYYIQLQEPTGFDAEGTIQYANDLNGTALSAVIGVVWLLPPIIGSALHLGLIRKVSDRLLRFRIGVVASSIFVWFLVSAGSSLGNIGETYDWWSYVSRAIAATVAALTLIAYRPPAALRRRLRLDEPPPA